MSNVECRSFQHCNNPSGYKRQSDKVTMEPVKRNSNERGNESKKFMQHKLKQSNKKGKTKSGKVFLTFLVLRSEGNIPQETRRKGTNVCNHCGRNDHQRKSRALCPFNVGELPDHTGMCMINDDQLPTVDIVPANTQEARCYMCIQGLQDRANQPNQLSVSN